MTRFRPCIDLHSGQVKQIVGGTLRTTSPDPKTNHISTHPASYFAKLYREHDCWGAHMIMLGPGNEKAAEEALAAWPDRLQIGGGITDQNAKRWIDRGAEKVTAIYSDNSRNAGEILLYDTGELCFGVNSFGWMAGRFSLARLEEVLSALGGDRRRLVIDLSCRRKDGTWFVAMNKWQTITAMEISKKSIAMLEPYCSEFLIHAADNEGLQEGVDEELVSRLAQWCSIPVTYAGGGRNLADLDIIRTQSDGKVDLTIGSALDIFGGNGVTFADCLAWNKEHSTSDLVA